MRNSLHSITIAKDFEITLTLSQQFKDYHFFRNKGYIGMYSVMSYEALSHLPVLGMDNYVIGRVNISSLASIVQSKLQYHRSIQHYKDQKEVNTLQWVLHKD